MLACWTAPGFGLQEPPAPPPAAPTQAESLVKVYQLISAGELQQAKEELDRATALAQGPCGECLLSLSHIYAAEKKWDQAVNALQQAIPLLKSPGLLAHAYNQLGMATAETSTRDHLAKAEDALRRAAELGGPWGALARYNLAVVLSRRHRWAEAAEAARAYLEEAGAGGAAVKQTRLLLCRARTHLPEEPRPEQGEPRRVGGEVKPPEIIFQQQPAYTREGLEASTAGTVIVESIIDEEGCVQNVRALQRLPNGLTEAAMQAIRTWVFSPATLDGRPVKVYYVLTARFGPILDPRRRP